MEIRYLPDTFIEAEDKDLLGFNEFAKSTHAAIKNSQPPFTWGIYGDWGSGKTSLMKLIKGRMEKDLSDPANASPGPLHIPVWFNAWEYENELNIIYPLFDAIFRDFSTRCPVAREDAAFLHTFRKVALGSLFGLTDLALRTVTKATIGEALKLEDITKSLKTVEENLQTVFSEWTDQVAETKQAFQDFVNEYVAIYSRLHPECGDLYLAIFIDDLDRCLPDVAIQILERIKNHLTAEKCIFILGVNRSVVYKSIQKKYGDLDIDGRQHLEKIIQYSVGVPQPSEDAIRAYGTKSLAALVPSQNTEVLEKYFEDFSQTLWETGFNNPRRIKRILNRYLNFVATHLDLDKTDSDFIENYDLSIITRLIILREYYQDFYSVFEELGFEAFNDISNPKTGDFSLKYGEKWKPLIPRFDRMRRTILSNFSYYGHPPHYLRVMGQLFGLED